MWGEDAGRQGIFEPHTEAIAAIRSETSPWCETWELASQQGAGLQVGVEPVRPCQQHLLPVLFTPVCR